MMNSSPKTSYLSSLRVALAIFVATTTACAQSGRRAEASPLRCDALGKLFQQYQIYHYSSQKLTDELKSRTAQQFVESIDPSRTLLLESEAADTKSFVTKKFAEIVNGNCTILDNAFSLIRERAAQDTKYAQEVVAGDFKVDETVKLVIDPDKRGYSKNSNERKKLVRSLIHFYMANYLKSGVELKKAKKQLVHRYELVEKRLQERVEKGQMPEIFAESFARSLDPHTSYLSYDSLVDFQINMQLSLEGIGAALRSSDGFTYIETIIPGGGAEKSGKIRPKDKIIAVAQDGEEPISSIDMFISDVVKMIRGKKGTKVTLTILRDSGSETKTFDVTIIRDKIDVKQQAAKLEVETRQRGKKKYTIGVLELPSFYGGSDSDGRSSYKDVKDLIKEAKDKNVESLVLDLSRNGGGYLEDAVRISGLFLHKGAVVATKDTDGDIAVLEDDDSSIEWSGPLVVLLSPLSASASEILAGALQSYDRAVVVGAAKSSFGKGSVQTLRPLPARLGAVKVTTGMYFLPNGQSTQQTGVTSDIVVPSLLSTVDMGEKDLDYSLSPQSTLPFRSKDVNKPGEKSAWTPISDTKVALLTKQSETRVSQTEAFDEIIEELKKAEEQDGVIDLSDFTADEDSDTKKKDTKPTTKDDNKENSSKLSTAKSKKDGEEEEEEEESRFEILQKVFVGEAVDIALDLAIGVHQTPRLGSRTKSHPENDLTPSSPARK